MASRKNLLAQQLSQVGVLKGNPNEVKPRHAAVAEGRPRIKSIAPPPPVEQEPHPQPLLHVDQLTRNESERAPVHVPVQEAFKPKVDIKALEKVNTELFPQNMGPYITYHRVPWQLEIRKEIFTPTEKVDNPVVLNLVFFQVVQDVYSPSCIRINKQDKVKMRSTLESQGITPRKALNNQKGTVKKMVVDTAREWPYYFSRLFPVTGGNKLPALKVVGVGHSGIRLLSRDKDLFEDNLGVLDHFRFEEVVDVSVPRPSTLQLHIGHRYIMIYTPRAQQLKQLIEAFCIECEKNVMYGRAMKAYRTREQTLLSFEKDDIIKLTRHPNVSLSQGWLYGSLNGRAGMFPAEYIQPLAPHEVANADSKDADIRSEASIYSTLPDGGKFSMLEFAMLHYRESPYRYEMMRGEDTGSIHGTFKMISSLKAKSLQKQQLKKRASQQNDWTWRDQVELVKWSKSPIQASLLKFESPQMNKLALECFIAIMQYMGDYPLGKGQRVTDTVYTILMACHNHPEMRDEVYCQLAKQTTNNRSVKQESLQQGWRMVAIVTAYFQCTDTLKPYILKYLEQAAYDNQRPQQALAAQCLHNFRTTIRYGGRKNVPSKVEVEALTRGRNTKRQMCILPGGMPVVLNVRSSSVVFDCLNQISARLEVTDEVEREEYTIFYVIQSENRYCPLSTSEYIFDITTELANQKKEFYLLFQRTSWIYPLVLSRHDMYIDVMFHQCLPDYLDGYLLPLPTNTLPGYMKEEIAMLAVLQYQAARKKLPEREILGFIPRALHNLSDMSPQQWINLSSSIMKKVESLSAQDSKHKFLEILSRWPLFGSTFFNVKSVGDPRVKDESLMAINKDGVHFLHARSHETLLSFPFTDIVSTRRFTTENGANFVDMKCGDLMRQKVTRFETDQGTDISGLIAQYIQIYNKKKQKPSAR